MPEISIIIPVYNTEKFLVDCLNSVLAQTFSDFEVLLINDGSTDESLEICQSYTKKDERLKIFSQENQGQGTARNRGLDEAQGNYITFIDSDDFVKPDYLQVLYDALMKNQADLSSCMMGSYSKKKGISQGIESREIQVFEGNKNLVHTYLSEEPFHFGPVTKLFRKETLTDIRFTEGVIYEDYFFNFQYFTKIEKAVSVDYAGYYYVKNDKSTVQKSYDSKQLDNISEQHKVLERVAKDYPESMPLANYNLAWGYYWLFSKLFQSMKINGKTSKIYFKALVKQYKADKKYI
ncbi:MAG: glycosyltransferase, partial [Streptococcaceae bacterium]|nr:glycosyltransferase [Streptococcaceae bacterium]